MVQAQPKKFELVEATIDDVHAEYKAGRLTARDLVKVYLDRIEAYDKNGPTLNAVITINPKALDEADALDAAYKAVGAWSVRCTASPSSSRIRWTSPACRRRSARSCFKDYVPTRTRSSPRS